ncbi:MAG: ATP-binding protein, partial [Chloroflexota bacterium]
DAREAALVDHLTILPVSALTELVAHLRGEAAIAPYPSAEGLPPALSDTPASVDLMHIKGQEHAKRALEIAAAGGHNLLMSGPPGRGKT